MTTMNSINFPKAWWLFNTHMETIWARKIGKVPAYTRQIVTTFDNDEVAFDYLPATNNAPTLVIFHGLEGCSSSHTVRQCATWFNNKGWQVIIPHFRTCAIMNKHARAYHAGDSKDCDWMLNYINDNFVNDEKVYAIGISLGGNVLAKWLAENPQQQVLTTATLVCAPLDLVNCSVNLERPFIRKTYGKYFLNRLKKKIASKLTQHPEIISHERLMKIKSIREFDNLITAPLHGFKDVDDYYQRASALPHIQHIKTTTLIIQSENDALISPYKLPNNPDLHHVISSKGGHSGFVTPPFPGSATWLSSNIYNFIQETL